MRPQRTLLASLCLLTLITASVIFHPTQQTNYAFEVTGLNSSPVLRTDLEFSGYEACSDCHEAEITAWQESAHFKTAPAKLTVAQAHAWGGALGIEDVTTDMRCVRCHGQPEDDEPIFASVGVSCESCHSASGGEDGWLDLHHALGTDSVLMADLMDDIQAGRETDAHRDLRRGDCQDAGMITSRNQRAIILNCLGCHAVYDEDLANVGHPTSEKFEFVKWSQGEVRHNLLMDATINEIVSSRWLFDDGTRSAANRLRQMYIFGQLVDLEYGFRERATILAKGKLLDRINERIENAAKELKRINKLLVDDDDERFDGLFANQGMLDDIDDKIETLAAGDALLYQDYADKIAEISLAFLDDYPDGEGLAEKHDKRFSRPVGDPYTPKDSD